MSRAKSGFTLVFYYVPEDKDELTMPNAFALPKDLNDITLTDIEQHFPLDGKFFFRFKYKYNDASVWLDLNNKQCKVPKCDNKIIMKVTRKEPKNTMERSQKAEEANLIDAGAAGKSDNWDNQAWQTDEPIDKAGGYSPLP